MLIKKDMHPVRKAFRGTLLVLLGLSLCFFAGVVTLRVIYIDGVIKEPMQSNFFKADIAQHRALAYFSDDVQDMEIAEKMLRYGFFSPLYSDEGVRMLEIKADAGYQPAIDRLAVLNTEGVIQPVQNK